MSQKSPSLGQIVRAFVGAIRATLTGKPPPTPIDALASTFPQTAGWMRGTLALIDEATTHITQHNLDRPAYRVHIEGRDYTLVTILEGVRFHASQEYPHLLRNEPAYARLAIQASNLNDQFRVTRAAEGLDLSDETRALLHRLAAHLAAIPSDS
jgi:hypothetical protein